MGWNGEEGGRRWITFVKSLGDGVRVEEVDRD